VLLFRSLHLMQTLYIQDYQMHNNVPRHYFLFSYDVAHQRKIEGRTAFENSILGEGIKYFCKRSDNDEVKRFFVCRTQRTGF